MLVRNNTTCPHCGKLCATFEVLRQERATCINPWTCFTVECNLCGSIMPVSIYLDVAYELLAKACLALPGRPKSQVDDLYSLLRVDYSKRYKVYAVNHLWSRFCEAWAKDHDSLDLCDVSYIGFIPRLAVHYEVGSDRDRSGYYLMGLFRGWGL